MFDDINRIEFKVWGRNALFTDPLTRIGGEKFSYQIPTYEALKGVAKSIYWKPTFIWVIDKVRVMKRIRTQTKGMKPLDFSGGNTLAIYTFLTDVEYQVSAHFEWNKHRPELEEDRNGMKHGECARRMLERGGRQDIFLGTRDCQAYIEPCQFGIGDGEHDKGGELTFGYMFYGFDYPDESGRDELHKLIWKPIMNNGVINFSRNNPSMKSKFVRKMSPKVFGLQKNMQAIMKDTSIEA